MGGLLAPELTSKTKLTPDIVSKANDIYLKAISAWNKSLTSQGLESVQTIKAVGSTAHFERDSTASPDELERVYGTPDVVYGDIDYLVEFPFPSDFSGDETERRKEENRIKRQYGQLMQEFFDSPESPKEVKAVSQPMLVIELPSGEHVQVDAIVTFPKYSNWMKSRYSSERGLKGYITGNLYAALGEALVLTIGTEGVLSRTRGGERVSSRVRKDVVIKSVSIDPQSFLIDIARYVIGSDDFEVSPTLNRYSGWDLEEVRLSDIGNGIVGLAETLEMNLKGYSAQYLLDSILWVFKDKLNGTIEKKEKMMAKKGAEDPEKITKLKKQNEKSLNLISSIFSSESPLNEQTLRDLIREVKSGLSEDLRIDKHPQADIIKQAIGDPNYLIHFSDLNKLGINPGTKYNTPAGIYGWHFSGDVIEGAKRNRIFASTRKYGHLMKVKDGAKVLWLGDDSKNDYLPSLTEIADILVKTYPVLDEPFKDSGMPTIMYLLTQDNWRAFSKTSSREDEGTTESENVYNFIMATAFVVDNNKRKISPIANKMFRSVGYDAVIDVECGGIIHRAEACQGFFTHKGGLEHVAVIENRLWKTGGMHLPVMSILTSPTATSELLMKALSAITSPMKGAEELGVNHLSVDDAAEGILSSLEIDTTRKAFTWEMLQHVLQYVEGLPEEHSMIVDKIREEVLTHPNADISHIVDLIGDSVAPGEPRHLQPDQMSVLTIALQNKNLPSDVLFDIYRTNYIGNRALERRIRRDIVRHPNCPVEILESAIDDIITGRQNPHAVDAALNPNAPEEKLINIVFDNRGILRSSTDGDWMNTKNIMVSPAFSDDITLEIIRQLPDVERLKGERGRRELVNQYLGFFRNRKGNISSKIVLEIVRQLFEHVLEYKWGARSTIDTILAYFTDLRARGKRLSSEDYNKFKTYFYGLKNVYKSSSTEWGDLPMERLKHSMKEVEPKKMNEFLNIGNLRKLIREVKML